MKLNEVYQGNCLDLMKDIPNAHCDLVFCDPPFNINYHYDLYKDNLPYQEYCDWSDKWISECVRVLKPQGSMYVAIGDEFAAELNIILKKRLHFRNWIIWKFGFGQNQRKKFNRCHTHILYYTKHDSKFTFNADAIKVPSARQLIYKDKRAKSGGKVPDDVWDFSRVCGTFKERVKNHPCQMPESVLERIILTSSNLGDIILDPMGGSGTTAAVSKRLKRNFITMDLSQTYCDEMRERLKLIP